MTRSGLVLIMVALLAGVAIGYVGGRSGGEPAPDGRERVPDADLTQGEQPAYVQPPAPSGGGAPTLEEAIARIELEDEEEIKLGDGVISGTVKDGEGQPMADVLVRATRSQQRKPQPRETSGAAPDDKSLEAEVKAILERRRFTDRTRREARTDPGGKYEITGLPDEDHQLAAFKEGWTIRGAPGAQYYRVRPGATVDFLGTAIVAVNVKVKLTDGTEPERANINARLGNGNLSFVWTPDHRTIHVQPGEYRFRAFAGDKYEMRSEEVEMDVPEAGPPSEVLLEVEDRNGIKGKVISQGTWNSGYVVVAAVPLRAGDEQDPDRLLTSQKQSWVQPGVRAEFSMFDLSEGTWLVGVVANQREVLVHQTVEIKGGIVELELEVPAPDDANSILVRVEAPDGKTLRDGYVRAGYQGPNQPGYSYFGNGALQEDGTWRVTKSLPPGWQEMEGGSYYIEAYSQKYGQKRTDFDLGGSGLVTIRFDEPGKLVVTLLDYKGSEYEGSVFVSVARKGTGAANPQYMYRSWGYGGGGVEEDGTKTITPLAPGEYQLSVYVTARNAPRRVVHEEPVTVKSGENQASVSLPALYKLTVVDPDPDANHRFALTQRGLAVNQGGSAGVKQDGGRVLFSRLPPGEYVLTMTGGRVAEKMVVRVPGTELVRFAPQVFSAMMVTVNRADGYLAEVGLKTGDLVTGLDGVEFKDETHMRARILESTEKESVKLSVWRGRNGFTVVADLAKLQKVTEAGGRWEASVR